MENIPLQKNQLQKIVDIQIIYSIEDKLEKLIDKETFDLITKALEYQSEMSSVEMEEAFIEGFSLAVSSLLESLSKK